MALFEKKSPYEKLKEMFSSLSDEEKAKFKAEMEDIDKAEDEREIDKIEEEKATDIEVKDEKAEEVSEETEEIGEEVDKAEEMEEPKVEEPVSEEPVEPVAEEVAEPVEETPVEEQPMEEPTEEVVTEERHEDLLAGLDARIKALEEKFMTINEPIKDIGVSGYGATIKQDINEDNRADDVIKKLGGYAH